MSGRRKRGNKYYLTFSVKSPNPKFDASKPPHWKDNPKFIWRSQEKPISSDLETFKKFQRDFDYDNEHRNLRLPNDRLSWSEFVERLKREVLSGKKKGTAERDLQALRAFERIVKPLRIAEVTGDMVSMFRTKRLEERTKQGKPISKSTVNIDLGAVKAALTKAVEWGYLREHPGRFVKKFTVAEKSRRALTREETACVVEASKKSWSRDAHDMLMFFLLTGVRLQEATHLLWDRVDMEKGTFRIEAWDSAGLKDWPAEWPRVIWSPKNSQIRTNPLDERLLPILRRRLKERKTPLVFPGPTGPRNRWRTGELFERMFKRAGVEGVTVHSLRHTYATRFAEDTGDLPTLSRLMGHSNPKITMVYFSSEVGHKRKQQKKMTLF